MPKRQQLVLEHLERVSGKVMSEYPEIIRAQLRGRAGVYALYRKDKLYYVGLASNLTVRLQQHLTDRLRGKWDRFSVYLTARDEHIKELESLILRIVVPGGNRTGGRLVHSKDLRGDLRKLIADCDALKLAELMGEKRKASRQGQATSKKAKGVPKGLLGQRRSLQGRRRGLEYHATLRPDGTIRYGQRTFQSPSAAAAAALGRACNGWTFWQYRDGSSQWAPLKNLRS